MDGAPEHPSPDQLSGFRVSGPKGEPQVVYLGAMPTAVAFTTWAYALARTSAGKLGITTYLVPPIAIVMGWAFLAETPTPLAYVGGALCLAGVGLSRRQPSRPDSDAAARNGFAWQR